MCPAARTGPRRRQELRWSPWHLDGRRDHRLRRRRGSASNRRRLQPCRCWSRPRRRRWRRSGGRRTVNAMSGKLAMGRSERLDEEGDCGDGAITRTGAENRWVQVVLHETNRDHAEDHAGEQECAQLRLARTDLAGHGERRQHITAPNEKTPIVERIVAGLLFDTPAPSAGRRRRWSSRRSRRHPPPSANDRSV